MDPGPRPAYPHTTTPGHPLTPHLPMGFVANPNFGLRGLGGRGPRGLRNPPGVKGGGERVSTGTAYP